MGCVPVYYLALTIEAFNGIMKPVIKVGVINDTD